MSFKDIAGHRAAIEILKKQIKTERISHAYLFTGKEGVGKKLLARQFAKTLFCPENITDSCDKCIVCRKIDHDNHSDLEIIEIEEDSNQLKIDQIRDMQKNIAYKPYEGKRKIYIIDDADCMTLQAANSLLKTLEEPPAYATIILLAEEVSKILPTIYSRCQQIELQDIPREKIKELLTERNVADQKAELLSRLAGGSPGKALQLCGEENIYEQRKEMISILVDLPEISKVKLFNYADKMTELFKQGFPVFDLLSNWYHDIILYKQGNRTDEIINYDYREDIKKQAVLYNINEVSSILYLLDRYQKYIEQNVKKDLALSVLLLKIRNKRV